MLAAMQLVTNPLVSLDVYSSCEVYGSSLKKPMINIIKVYMTKLDNYLMSTTLAINQMNI
jgi:hypothetical protein